VHIAFGAVRRPQEVIDDPQLGPNEIVVPLEGAGGKLTSFGPKNSSHAKYLADASGLDMARFAEPNALAIHAPPGARARLIPAGA